MKEIKLSDHFTYTKLLLFAMPTIGMILISITYDVVDGYFVSNYIGKTGFSAINIIYPFQLLLSMVGYMFGSGGSALIAAELGNGKPENANRYFTAIIKTAVIIGILMTVLGIWFLRPVAVLIGATPEILEYGLPYGHTLFLFLPIMILGYTFQSILITAEKPKLGFYISLGNLFSNLLFDWLFVAVFHWGMVGAAVATGIGACLNGLIPLIYFARPNSSSIHFCKGRVQLKPLLKAYGNGSSEMVNDMSTSLIFALYNFQLLRMLGEDGVAAYGVTIFVEGIFASVFYGLAMQTTSIVGYHFGAQNYPELKNLLKKGLILNIVFGMLMFVLARVTAPAISKIYVGYDETVYRLSIHALSMYAFAFLLQGFNEYASAYFTGLNNGLVSGLLAFFRTFIIQTVLILVLPEFLGTDGLWLAQAVTELLASMIAIFFFITRKSEYCGPSHELSKNR
ncbi:MATE family efflux transporter [Oribacterium sp. FC2011]|uniref:MATE family efflux transporter n=1 Tax=Oribacterium sp. FC2011 TaxID=1408311 RepID=UPI0005D2851D|nr:MATE family efflux transporter [Oribacterium sp. FC2011]